MINSKRIYFSQLIFKLLPPTKFNKFKSKMLRWSGVKVGENVNFFSSAKIYGDGMTLHIGDYCFIGHDAILMGAKGSSIIIENFAKVGTRSIVVTGAHRHSIDGDCIVKEGLFKNITIKRGAVISTGCIIQPGVIVNEMAYIAPGSVVTKEVPAFHRVAGVPAKIIKDLRK